MKRMLYLLLAMVLLMMPLVGCDNAQPDDATQEEQPPAEETPDTPEDTEPTQPEQEEEEKIMSLKIGSFNIGNGSYVGHDLSILANDITSQGLDIVGLQEVDRLANRSKNLDTLAELSRLTGYEYYYFAKAINLAGDPATYGQDGEYGIGILSKYPILEGESYQLPSGGREQRMLARATIDVAGKEINFFTTHLSFEDDKVREGQLSQIDNILFDYSSCILTGDFNLRATAELDVLLGMHPSYTDEDPIVTYSRDDWSTHSIDNICFSSSFELEDCYAVENDHSDHYLLVSKLTIK